VKVRGLQGRTCPEEGAVERGRGLSTTVWQATHPDAVHRRRLDAATPRRHDPAAQEPPSTSVPHPITPQENHEENHKRNYKENYKRTTRRTPCQRLIRFRGLDLKL